MKQSISATIDRKLAEWVNSELRDNIKYRNKSHLIEIALQFLKKKEEKNR